MTVVEAFVDKCRTGSELVGKFTKVDIPNFAIFSVDNFDTRYNADAVLAGLNRVMVRLIGPDAGVTTNWAISVAAEVGGIENAVSGVFKLFNHVFEVGE